MGPNLKVKPADIRFPDRTGFARLKKGKLIQISTAASRIGCRKGGHSLGTRQSALSRGNFFQKLQQPFPKIKGDKVKLEDAAKLFGVTRQTFRKWNMKYRLESERNGTATLFEIPILQELRRRLRLEMMGL